MKNMFGQLVQSGAFLEKQNLVEKLFVQKMCSRNKWEGDSIVFIMWDNILQTLHAKKQNIRLLREQIGFYLFLTQRFYGADFRFSGLVLVY